MTNKKRIDIHEELLKKMAKLITAIAKARQLTNPAYPFHPTMKLNDGMKLLKEIKELADNLDEPQDADPTDEG